MRALSFLLLFLSLCATWGCQQYPIRPMPAVHASEAPARAASGLIHYGAKAYTDGAEIKAVFNADLLSKGVLPVLLIVDNQSATDLEIVRPRIELSTSSGQEIEPIAPDAATTGEGRNALAEAVFFFGIFSYDDANKYNDEMRRDWIDKAEPEVQIVRAGLTSSKFLYFNVGKDFSPQGSVLHVAAQNFGSGQMQTITLKF